MNVNKNINSVRFIYLLQIIIEAKRKRLTQGFLTRILLSIFGEIEQIKEGRKVSIYIDIIFIFSYAIIRARNNFISLDVSTIEYSYSGLT